MNKMEIEKMSALDEKYAEEHIARREKEIQDRRDQVVLETNIDPETVKLFDMSIHHIEVLSERHLAISGEWGVVWIKMGNSLKISDNDEGFYTLKDTKKDVSIDLRPSGCFTVHL